MNIYKYISSFFSDKKFRELLNDSAKSEASSPLKTVKIKRRLKHYTPDTESFALSRSKLELFMSCKRCFFLDQRLGIKIPGGRSFALNNAVDQLLKNEFDHYRLEQKPHPICIENKINAIPFQHEDLNVWRASPHHGIKYKVPNTNLIIKGSIDDVWLDLDTDELMVVDKATSKKDQINLDGEWQKAYKRQVEIYQWLLRKNGFKVSNTAYFIYCNANKEVARFDKQLNFNISLLSYEGNDSWIDKTVFDVYKCLQSLDVPLADQSCDYCNYRKIVSKNLGK